MTASQPARNGLSIGRSGLRQLHVSLSHHAPDQAIAVLQEAGYASGAEVYEAFSAWLSGRHGVAVPQDLAAELLGDALSEFFRAHGWGTLDVQPLGASALAVDSADWAEADPGTAEAPMCFFSAGMLADFLGRLAGEAVAVMEVECRSRSDARCRFLSANPEVLQRVYEQMTHGQGYEQALGAR
jgi:predicted hydrocarbon binding protein